MKQPRRKGSALSYLINILKLHGFIEELTQEDWLESSLQRSLEKELFVMIFPTSKEPAEAKAKPRLPTA